LILSGVTLRRDLIDMTTQHPEGNYIVRRMTRQELDVAVEWAAAEGWNPGRGDADRFFAADPNGFLIGLLDGKPVASLSAVAYDSTFGFLGFYIVKPELRGLGCGIKVWQAAMNYLGDRNIGLDGVLAQQSNYEKSGFVAAYRHVRHEGIGGGETPNGIVKLPAVKFDDLLEYDAPLFGTRRPAFLRGWVDQPGATTAAALKNGKLAGYAVMRPCLQGFKIGPLFADDESTAEDLFQAMAAGATGQPIILDVPETNAAALALARRHQMKTVFETVRMYNKSPLRLDVNRIYGITTFELG
jgi:GNAT superfamily N-acetyltransferase